jgi:hypothetical protein
MEVVAASIRLSKTQTHNKILHTEDPEQEFCDIAFQEFSGLHRFWNGDGACDDGKLSYVLYFFVAGGGFEGGDSSICVL